MILLSIKKRKNPIFSTANVLQTGFNFQFLEKNSMTKKPDGQPGCLQCIHML